MGEGSPKLDKKFSYLVLKRTNTTRGGFEPPTSLPQYNILSGV